MIAVIAGAVAVAFGLVVTLFCAYELRWKVNRLRRDLVELEPIVAGLRTLQAELARVIARA